MLTIPCIIIHDKKRAEEIAIIENIQRKDLHPVELMKAYTNLLKNNICKSYGEISNKVGVSKSSVVEIMNLRNLNDEIKEMLVRKSLKSRDFLRELCKIDQEKQAQAINDFLLKKKENKKVKVSRSIKTKSKVLDIYLNNNILEVNINKIEQLTVSQKEEFVNIMRSVIQDINNA